MELTLSNIKLTSKPTSGKIKTTVTRQSSVNFEDLKNVVLNYAFNSALAGGISEKDWISQQIFTLDFDSGITPEDVLTRCRISPITPNLIYTTYSDKPELRKFRVLFILDKVITEYKIAKWLQRGLMKLFPEADAACSDLCRMFYPGKELIFSDEEYNDLETTTIYAQGQVADNERFFDKFEYRGGGENIEKIKDYDWDSIIDEVEILKKFFGERVRLSYSILFGLITNAVYIYGGEKKILNRMKEINELGGGLYFPDESRGIEKYPKDYFISLQSVKKFKYIPKSLKNFSPFESDWDFKNLLEMKFKRGRIEILKEKEMISLKNAETLLKDSFQLAKKNIPFRIKYTKPDMFGENKPYIEEITDGSVKLPINPIYIFKVTTGAGKTQAFNSELETLISAPTHKLKEEISDRMLVSHNITPVAPTFSNWLVNETINELREVDLYTEVSSIIKNISTGSLRLSGNPVLITEADREEAKIYLQQNKKCSSEGITCITTHTRAINDLWSFNYKNYIFDEDPLNNIVEIDNFSIDFTKFDGTQYKAFVTNIEDFLRTLPVDCVLDFPSYVTPKGFERFCATIGMGKLIKLLRSEFVFKDGSDKSKINFLVQKRFLEDKKIFIMSATAPISIYKKLFPNRVIVIDISNIKPAGVIHQYTKRSFSSYGFTTYNTRVYNELFGLIPGTKVITHLKHQQKFKSHLLLDDPTISKSEDLGRPHNFYFGNCSGGDKLKGYDISVIGTPGRPEFVYLFLAKLIGLPNSIDRTLSYRIVEWNNYRFKFYTYNDPDLSDIRLSLIESELLQAAGRGRFLRLPTKTLIFSSLPLHITTHFIEK